MSSIVNVLIFAPQLATIMSLMDEATSGLLENEVILSALAFAITTSNPNISAAQLAEGLQSLSEHLALWLNGLNEPRVVN